MKTKRLPLLVLPLLLIITSAPAQTPSQAESPWKMYTISGEDFSVALPNVPAFHTTHEWEEPSHKKRRIYSLAAYADGLVYVVYVYENPNRRQSLDSFLKKAEIPKSSLTDLTVNGFPGKERRRPEYETMSQFFATEHRLYHFMAMGTPVDDPRMTKFFSSLSLHRLKDSIQVVDGPGLPWEPPAEPEAADDETSNKMYTGKEVDRKVRLGMKPEPSYTEAAREKSITGTVVLKVIFRRNGSVTDIRTASGLPYGLTEKAIDAARKIKFIPGMKNGKFISMWMQLEYNFNLY
ncbi:MAG TPA: energy transducer TonB [Pyrinomonadaceae bacterium]